jgi:hypothetical protein
LSGKYDPLRDHLASQAGDAQELIMTFHQLDQLVKRLPSSARQRQDWWDNPSDARAQVRAWRQAGWHVRSADLEAEIVVFARGATPAATLGPSLPQEPLPGTRNTGSDPDNIAVTQRDRRNPAEVDSTEGRSKSGEDSWRSMRSELIAGGVAAVAAGVAAIVALVHLPWLVIVLLSGAVGAIAFSMTQALTSRKIADKSKRWWSIAAVSLVLTVAAAFTYHEKFDPSTHTPAVPFTVVVKTDPGEVLLPTCRTIVFPGPWHDIRPPLSLTATSVNDWERSHHGIDGNQTAVLVELQGRSDQVVTISQPQVRVTEKKPPVGGPAAELSGGCGGELENRVFQVNLDQQNPVAILVSGTSYPSLQAGSKTIQQALSPNFKISASDPEYFVIVATTKKTFSRWDLTLSWQSMGKSGTVLIQNGSTSFGTSAINPAVNVLHTLVYGTWLTAPSSGRAPSR